MGHSFLQGTGPIPREMSFPVPKGTAWHDLYDHIKYTVLPNFFGILFVTYFYEYREISCLCIYFFLFFSDYLKISPCTLQKNPKKHQSTFLRLELFAL